MKIVVINGYPMSGKDQFCNYCLDYMKKNRIYGGSVSTIDVVKNIMTSLGWDGLKTPKDRKFMSDFKKLLIEWNDVPFNFIQCQIHSTAQHFRDNLQVPLDNVVFFIHSREPEEIKRFKETMGAITLFLKRDEMATLEQSNDSDKNVSNFEYDYTIENNGTLEELELKAMNFIKDICRI